MKFPSEPSRIPLYLKALFPMIALISLDAVLAQSSAVKPKAKAHTGASAPKTAPTDGVIQDPTIQNIDGCSALIDKHCKDLYKTADKLTDPQPGNRDIKVGNDTVRLRLGENEHGLDYSIVRSLERQIETKDKLPADLKEALDKSGYFADLQKLLKETDLNPTSIQKERAFAKIVGKIANKSADALTDTAIARVEKKYPDYSTKEDPLNEEHQYMNEVSDDLTKEITGSLWVGSPEWDRVTKQFNEVQLNYVAYLNERKDLPKAVKDAWIAKIRSVKLVPPDGEDGSTCFATEVNAFYREDRNTFTVCAGLFNSADDMRFVIAHELGHSIDPSAQTLDQIRKTPINQAFIDLKTEVCGKAPMSECPKSFAGLQDSGKLAKMLAQIKTPAHAKDSFYQCLHYKKKLDAVNPATLDSYAQNMERSLQSQMADANDYLTLTHPETISEKGRKERNINYLNPCGKKKVKPDEIGIDTEDETIFVAAFLCSKEKDPVARLDDAKNVTSAISTKIYEKKMAVEGSLSQYPVMVGNNNSEVVNERFADSLASGVYARWVKGNFPEGDTIDRRNQTLASLSLFCERSSLQEDFPVEAQWEKKMSFEPHSDGKERLLEIIKDDLREQLDCRKEPGRQECSL